jgi:hypothetical protein
MTAVTGSQDIQRATTARSPGAAVPPLERLLDRARAAARCAVFVLKMIPARRQPIDHLTRRPIVGRLSVQTAAGPVEVELYRPRSAGPHPGVVASFGVNPTGVMDPRVAQMGDALARAGFATLLYWPPSARDLAIEPADVEELVVAFEALVSLPIVDPHRSGFAGICVGGSLALLAAADPRIRRHVAFVAAYAPYASMASLTREVAGGTCTLDGVREPWAVDPLTWQVWVRSVTGWLGQDEARLLRDAHEGRITWNATKTEVQHRPGSDVDPDALTDDGRAALRLLTAGAGDVDAALEGLPPAARERLVAMSPLAHAGAIEAPRIVILHDRRDHVIPVSESRRLVESLTGRPGLSYTELGLRHLRMPGEYSIGRIAWELWRSYLAWYPLFLETTTSASRRRPT